MSLPASPVPLWRPIAADPARYFSAEQVAKAKSYTKPLRRARAFNAAIGGAVLLAFLFAQAAPNLLDAVGVRGWAWQVLIVNAVLGAILSLAQTPVAAWKEFRHERSWGFSTQTPKRFAADRVKQYLIAAVLEGALIVGLWAVVRGTDLWWVWGSAVIVGFFVLIGALAPVVIMPLFNKFTPLADEALRARLAALAARAAVPIKDFLVMDASKRTRKDNAFFTGAGKTRRIVIFDNMLEMPHESVEVVVAHELGHWRRKHLMQSVAFGIVTWPLVLGITKLLTSWSWALDRAGVGDVRDPGAVPLFLAAFGIGFAGVGFTNAWFSRWLERQADLDALELTRDLAAYRSVWNRFSERDLPDLDPSFYERLKMSHPPVAQRIAFGELWEQARQPAR